MRKFAASMLLLLAIPAAASAQILTFEGVNSTHPTPNDYATVGGFYNGGVSGDGTSGTNYGISFTNNALGICLNTPGALCSNTSRGGLGDPNSARTGLFWLAGTETFMNVSAGFTGGFSFLYSAVNQGGNVTVWDDVNGSGNLLTTLVLGVTPSTCDVGIYQADFCSFVAAGSTFVGTAKSVAWGGVANQIVFDDVTLGSDVPGNPGDVVPEPATMTLLATGLAGMAASRRKRRSA